MDTQKRTPHDLFGADVQYLVPLFQRSYVWDREFQWEPLWDDVRDTATRFGNTGQPFPHFLGAIVLKQLQVQPGELPKYLVVDGQQRLTTLQLALAGIRDALEAREALDASLRESLHRVRNLTGNTFGPKHKIEPFNTADVEAFRAIMNQEAVPDALHPVARCHAYFREQSDALLGEEVSEKPVRDLVHAAQHLLQIVSITLDANENEHLIFETLNARAEPLTEWDKARNLFLAEISDAYDKQEERAFYKDYLQVFDNDAWWTEDVYAQRKWGKRVSAFLRYWLEVEHQRPIPPHRVYYWFRRLTRERKRRDTTIRDIADSFVHYSGLFEQIEKPPIVVDSLEGRFFYRRSTLVVGVLAPLLMKIYDLVGPGSERDRCIRAIDGWLVRRLLVGYNAMGYDKFFLSLLERISAVASEAAAGEIADQLVEGLRDGLKGWPDDGQVRSAVVSRPMYPGWHSAGRVRMILEAIEDHLIGKSGMAGAPAVPRNLWIEHLMPQSWKTHWPLPEGEQGHEEARDEAILTLGNLTLTNAKLDITLSNRPWPEKVVLLEKHDNLFLNRELLEHAPEAGWNEDAIRARGRRMAQYICEIWPHADAL